jgi:trimethylamine--corrinoid protein Co-methyltransferase
VKTGMRGGVLKMLTDDEIDRLHNAALRLLREIGVFSESSLFLDIFAKSGAVTDREARTIRLPAEMVEAAIASAPSTFILHGRRDEANSLLLEPGRVYYGMGGTSEPLFFDYTLGRARQPTKQDMVACTRLGHALSNIDFVQTLCMAGDYPAGEVFFHDFDAIFRNTSKPTVLTILERPFTQHLLEMAAAASGGEDSLRESPSMLGIVTPISPLKIAVMNEGLIDVVEAGVPVLYSPGPLMGATAPATVAGTVVLTVAEALFGVVLTQLIRPGAPIVVKPDTDVFDMRTTQVTYGSPEQNLGKMAISQMAQRYGIPVYGLGGGVEAKFPDAEAAAEAAMEMLLNGLAGMTLSQSLGTLAFGMYGSQEMVVMCDEIVNSIRRVLEGITIDGDTLALDVIREVGYGGSFLGHNHTARHFRREMYFPKLFKRQSMDEWVAAGAKQAHQVAHDKVVEILSQAGPIRLPASVERAMEEALRRAVVWAEGQSMRG